MSHLLRYALIGITLFLTITTLGCGGAGSPAPVGQPGPQADGLPAPRPGVQMPALPPDSFDVDNLDRATSATYRIFFRDTVNHQSVGRWTTANNSGFKAWSLSNTFFSSPKAWVCGGNYWHNEDDELESTSFDIEDGTDGLAVTFYARYNVAAGDHATVFFWDGDSWEQVIDFTNSSNTNYPNWDKFYFQLPANTSGMTQSCQIAFQLTSDGATNSWGFGVDSVAVYQTQLGTPLGLIATDGDTAGQVDLDWDHVQVGTLLPDGYDIYRAEDENGTPGTYTLLDSTVHPDSFYSDITGDGTMYWYKVVATKAGWMDSPDSNEDTGHGLGTWMNLTVDTDGNPLYSSVAALASGNPAIAYYDQGTGDVRFAYSSQPDGSSGWTDVLVDSTNDVGFTLSLAIIDGNPAIAYFDNTDFDLQYAYSSQADGSSGWTVVDVETAGSVGTNSSLGVVNGFPAISYTDNLGDLKYAYSSQTDGSSGWTAIYVDGPLGDVLGYDTSLAVINGFPGISHGNNSDGTLMFSYSTQADGSSGWATVQVGGIDGQGSYTSMQMVNGFPAIAYQTSVADVKYAYSTMADGSGGWTTLTVETTAPADGYYTSLEVPYGKPAIASQDNTNGDLKYASSTAPDGSGGWTSIIVDGAGGAVGEYCNMAIIDGKPAISYRDADNTALKYAWLE